MLNLFLLISVLIVLLSSKDDIACVLLLAISLQNAFVICIQTKKVIRK